MPPETPLAHAAQDFGRTFRDVRAPGLAASFGWRRLVVALPTVGLTGGVLWAFAARLSEGGWSWLEMALVALIGFTVFWIMLSVSTSALGAVSLLRRSSEPQGPGGPLSVALLVPVYNEVPEDVFGNAGAMLSELARSGSGHAYTLFVLSDTTDAAIAAREELAFARLREALPEGSALHYRRRARNTDRKVGNLADWVHRWGGGFEAMLVLDADSLMSGRAIVDLTDALAADGSAGLIQSLPRLIGAQTLFGRAQQFANVLYGPVLAEGLAAWTDREGNYWGHNAIIRTRAFAACAGLPKLGRRGRLILSHDFVEAGLLRRAGWGVRFVPRVGGSYEEVPPTLIDYALRDRRWCQGNLQHLRLLGSKGFHPVSRFHLLQGAMSYLLSPAWFALLVIWALVGIGAEANVVHYFVGLNPQVSWPVMTGPDTALLLALTYGLLLAPKVLGAVTMHRAGLSLSTMGGPGRFARSVVSELALSVLYAPVLMVQQTLAVLRTALGLRVRWVPQARHGGSYGWRTVLGFHALETVLGAALLAGMAFGLVTWWLVPIGVSLVLAVPLSRLSGVPLSERWLETPEMVQAPPVLRAALEWRENLRSAPERVAAE